MNLGRLEIPQEDAEIEFMDWLAESATATITAQVPSPSPPIQTDNQTKARQLEKETSSEHDTIAQLQNQLDALIKAKDDYETELLTKVPPKKTLTI